MAHHLRRQIRDAFVDALVGLPTTSARVFAQRAYELQESELPALKIETYFESVAASQMGFPRLYERRLRLRVIAIARVATDLDDALDQICKEVEMALAMPVATLAGLVKDVVLLGTDIAVAADSQPVGQAALTYEVFYMAAANAPDVAL